MKKSLVSIALSTAVLAGGLLGAGPANAAPVNYDAKIKTIQNKIQVEKWKVYGSTTNHATTSDKQAYNFFVSNAKKKQAAFNMECSARGLEKFVKVVTKTKNSGKLSSSAQKHYNTVVAQSSKDTKNRFATANKMYKEAGIDLNKSVAAEKKGKSFKYKKAGMQSYFKNYSNLQSKCNMSMVSSMAAYQIVYSSSSVSANNKHFTQADKNAINQEIRAFKNKEKSLVANEKKSAKQLSDRSVAYDKSIKSKITSFEKELSSVKASKAKAKK